MHYVLWSDGTEEEIANDKYELRKAAEHFGHMWFWWEKQPLVSCMAKNRSAGLLQCHILHSFLCQENNNKWIQGWITGLLVNGAEICLFRIFWPHSNRTASACESVRLCVIIKDAYALCSGWRWPLENALQTQDMCSFISHLSSFYFFPLCSH